MPIYTVQDNDGKVVKFEWNNAQAPTEKDIGDVFAESSGSSWPKAPRGEMSFEQDRPIRQAISNIYRPVLETAGLVGGGSVGSATGPVGAVTAAGIGYASGKKTADILDNIIGLKKSGTIKEELVGSAEDISEGAMMEMGGQLAGKVIGKVLSPASKKMTPAAITAEQEAKDVGITLTPGETTGSKTQQLFESLMDKTPFASSVTQEWRLEKQLTPLIKARNKFLESGHGEQNAEVLGLKIKDAIDKHLVNFGKAKDVGVNAMRNSLLKRLGSQEGYETLGKDVQEILASKSVAAVAKKNKIYQDIAESMPGGELSFKSFDNKATKILEKIDPLPNQSTKLKNILKIGAEKSDKDASIIKEISQYPKQVQDSIAKDLGIDLTGGATKKDWSTMQGIRSHLNELIKAEDLSVKMNAPHLKGQLSNNGRLYKSLKDAIDKDFERLAKESGTDAFEKLKIANVFFKEEYAPVWKSKLIQKMAYTSPEKVVDVAFKPGSIAEVRLAKKALGEKGFKPLQTSFTNKLLGKGKDEVFSPKKLSSAINKYGDEMLSEIYTKNELYALKDLATTGKILLDKKLPGQNILRTIASNTQNTIVDSIIGSAEKFPGSKTVLKNITILKPFLKKSEQEGLRQAFSERLFKINQTTDMVQPIQLSKTIKTYDKVLPKFYNQEEISFLRKIGNTGQKMALAEASAANPSGTAQNVIAWTVFGAVLIAPINELMQGDIKGSATAGATGIVSAVLLPKHLAKIALSKTGRKYFTNGLLTNASTKKGIELATKIITSISKSEKQTGDNHGK